MAAIEGRSQIEVVEGLERVVDHAWCDQSLRSLVILRCDLGLKGCDSPIQIDTRTQIDHEGADHGVAEPSEGMDDVLPQERGLVVGVLIQLDESVEAFDRALVFRAAVDVVALDQFEDGGEALANADLFETTLQNLIGRVDATDLLRAAAVFLRHDGVEVMPVHVGLWVVGNV